MHLDVVIINKMCEKKAECCFSSHPIKNYWDYLLLLINQRYTLFVISLSEALALLSFHQQHLFFFFFTFSPPNFAQVHYHHHTEDLYEV